VNSTTLAPFVGTRYSDTCVEVHNLLLACLEHLLNAARHESLVKRLLKSADNAGDDGVMAASSRWN
jgi:hypothetical protein